MNHSSIVFGQNTRHVRKRIGEEADFRQDPRLYNPEDPRNLSKRTPLNTTAVAVLFLVFCAIIVAVIVIGIFLSDITNRGKEGCTLRNYDNYQRGFGIDNGSCIVEHSPNQNKRIVGCPESKATYYDIGGPDDGYAIEDDDDDDDPYSSVLRLVAQEDPTKEDTICVRFLEFDINGHDNTCVAASMNITGSGNGFDGIYCNQKNPLQSDQLICGNGGNTELYFNFTTDGSTNGTGWQAEIICGLRGCNHTGYENFDSSAEIDDGTCTSFHPSSNTEDSIIELCGDGSYLDSGGESGEYPSNEFIQKVFNSSDPERVLCFEFTSFDVQSGCGDCCDFLFVEESSTAYDGPLDGMHCNGLTSLQNEKICSKLGEPIYFKFSSDPTIEKEGWKAIITCEKP